jgi:hypothetical protein
MAYHIRYTRGGQRLDDSVLHLAQRLAEEFIFEWRDSPTPDVATSATAAQASQRLRANELFSKLKQFTGIRLSTSAK